MSSSNVFTVGVKVCIKDLEGGIHTGGPVYLPAASAMRMCDMADELVRALALLEGAGAIDSYAVVLKCMPGHTAQEVDQ
jgi:hypothetical protein